MVETFDYVRTALESWWTYLDIKLPKIDPALSLESRLVDDSYSDKTIWFSLVENIAPELRGLGRLVNARRPHVYVHGTRSPEYDIPFKSLYTGHRSASTFPYDPENKFPLFLAKEGISPDSFVLNITSSNDIDSHTADRLFGDIKQKEILFFKDSEGREHAFTIFGGEYIFKPIPGSFLYKCGLDFRMDKKLRIYPTTDSDLVIVSDSFRQALADL